MFQRVGLHSGTIVYSPQPYRLASPWPLAQHCRVSTQLLTEPLHLQMKPFTLYKHVLPQLITKTMVQQACKVRLSKML